MDALDCGDDISSTVDEAVGVVGVIGFGRVQAMSATSSRLTPARNSNFSCTFFFRFFLELVFEQDK
jgi:hypothetical protein